MKFQFYYEKLIHSEEYQKFRKEHPEAFACTGFFVLDKEKTPPENKVNFDFWLPKEKKMYSFKLDGKVEFVNVENFDPRTPEKLFMNYDFDLEDFANLIQEKQKEENIKGEIKKYIFSLQKLDNEEYFIVTVFLNNMALMKLNIKLNNKEISSFEKKSFLDMFKIIKKGD